MKFSFVSAQEQKETRRTTEEPVLGIFSKVLFQFTSTNYF